MVDVEERVVTNKLIIIFVLNVVLVLSAFWFLNMNNQTAA